MEYVTDRFHCRSLTLAHAREEVEDLQLKDSNDVPSEQKLVARVLLPHTLKMQSPAVQKRLRTDAEIEQN